MRIEVDSDLLNAFLVASANAVKANRLLQEAVDRATAEGQLHYGKVVDYRAYNQAQEELDKATKALVNWLAGTYNVDIEPRQD